MIPFPIKERFRSEKIFPTEKIQETLDKYA